jgi:DNA polymerase III subunit alpha
MFIDLVSAAFAKILPEHCSYGDAKERLSRELKDIDFPLVKQFEELESRGEKVKNTTNSLILYLNGLTDEEPYGEFQPITRVTSDRTAAIDIDLDVSAERRGEVIEFINTKMQAYPILAFSTINEKSGIKDLGKALGFPYSMVDSISKALEDGSYNELSDVIARKYPNFFNEVKKLQGVIRHVSTHASGIAIFNGLPEDNFISLRRSPRVKGQNTADVSVDIDGTALETLGIMKIDLLGSATTDVISETEKMAGIKVPSIDELIEDEFILSGFEEVNVAGIFQAGGHTNKRVFDLVRPKTFMEVADCISLGRPGTKDQLNAYIKYEPIINNELVLEHLISTRGVILYQEQVLAIAMDIGGLTGREAEILRRGIGKKKDEEFIAPVKNKLIENARAKIGNDADTLWELIAAHIGYSFNKSHAVAYSAQAFREMFLKLTCPTEFWCSMLANCKEDEKYEYRNEIASSGIKLLAPCLSQPFDKYCVPASNTIQLPLRAIKGIGDIDLQPKECSNIQTALQYVGDHVNKKVIVSLIQCGFFSCINPDIEEVLNLHQKKGQLGLFEEETKMSKMSVMDKYLIEKELFGFWIDNHPMMSVRGVDKISDVMKFGGDTLWGIVSEVKTMSDKRGKNMCFLKLDDETGYASVAIFSNIMDNMEFVPYINDIISVKGYFRGGGFIATEPVINVRGQ